jgi:Chaperone of endosialidase
MKFNPLNSPLQFFIMRIQLILSLSTLLYSTTGNAQYVGIGVANPTLGRLQVNGGVGKTTAIFGGDSIGISLQRNLPGIGYNQYDNATPLVMGGAISLLQSLSTANGSMYFDFYNTNQGPNTPPLNYSGRMTIRNNGNVSLNTAEANTSLFVMPYSYQSASTVALKGTLHKSEFMQAGTQSTSVNGGLHFSDLYINDAASLGNVYMGSGTSKIGINRANPQASLDIGQVNNRGLILVNPNNFSNWEFAVTKNLTEPGSDLYLFFNEAYRGNFFHIDGDYYQLSDQRFKTAVEPLPSVLGNIMQLRPVEYQFAGVKSGNQKTMGFIAQEVAAIFPELVSVVKDSSGGYEGITDLHMLNYDGFGPLAIKAIQEQQEKIKIFRDENATLKKRIEVVRKNLKAMEKLNQSHEKK